MTIKTYHKKDMICIDVIDEGPGISDDLLTNITQSYVRGDNLKKSGAFIPGIRPGEQTATYIDDITTKLTTIGAIYITSVCLLPEFLILYFNVPFYFGGTSLLIVVTVAIDTVTQAQSHMLAHQYSGLIKKRRLGGYTR